MNVRHAEVARYRNRVIFTRGDKIVIVKNGAPLKRKFTNLQEATAYIDSRVR